MPAFSSTLRYCAAESIKGRTPTLSQVNKSRSKAMVILDHQAAFAIVDPENQLSLGRERRTAPFQQGQLLIGGQILQDIQNQNQTGWRKLEMTDVRKTQVCVQGAESLASDGNPMRIQVATNQAPAAVTASRKTESHAVAAAEIHYRSRSQVFSSKQAEDPIKPQLPPDEPTVGPCASGKHPVHKSDAVPQSRIGGRLKMKMDHNCGNCRPNATGEYTQHHAAHHPG